MLKVCLCLDRANLSNDYFTNRQDRYHLISSAEITSYFANIHRAACSISYRVTPSSTAPGGFTLDWPSTNAQPAPLADPDAYRATATALLAPLLKPSAVAPSSSRTNTQIYPLIQLTPLLKPNDTSTELTFISKILTHLATPAFKNSSWTFTAGYFNMTPLFRNLLLSTSPASATVVAASPWANGFYGSKGVSGMLPAAYTYLGRSFLTAVESAGLSSRVQLKEWRKGTVGEEGGWTYHAKGLWVTLPGEEKIGPSICVVGSSNYTKRSYGLDLEANVAVVTRDKGLMGRLKDEERWLQEYAEVVNKGTFEKVERRVGLHVRIAMWIVGVVGGAL